MLTATELAQLREDILETLVSDVTVQRSGTTTNDAGAWTEGFSTVATVKGRIDNLSRNSANDLIALAEKGKAFYQLTVVYDANIQDGDRVQVGGVTYEVKQINVAQDLRAVKRGIVVKVGA